jgi:N-acetylglucosaminylphosphatidylinositol deacetylase
VIGLLATHVGLATFDHVQKGRKKHSALTTSLCSAYVSSDAKAPDAWMVSTTSVLRKYISLGDLPLTALPFTFRMLEAVFFPTHAESSPAVAETSGSEKGETPGHGVASQYDAKALVANTWHRYLMTRKAFRSHNTQYSWDRHLYMVLSRYVWFNDLVKVPRPSVDDQAHKLAQT